MSLGTLRPVSHVFNVTFTAYPSREKSVTLREDRFRTSVLVVVSQIPNPKSQRLTLVNGEARTQPQPTILNFALCNHSKKCRAGLQGLGPRGERKQLLRQITFRKTSKATQHRRADGKYNDLRAAADSPRPPKPPHLTNQLRMRA